jgi:Domain of unknown function (DUF4136)
MHYRSAYNSPIGGHARPDSRMPAFRGAPGWWGGPSWGTSVDVRQYHEGTLSVDIFDAHSHRPVWHGWAKKELTPSDMKNSTQPIQNAVASVLARFPPA